MPRNIIHVAVGAVEGADGRILITKRSEDVHQGGLWEFPGGKLEAGETLVGGLRRELEEELGIHVLASEPLIRIHHDYGDRRVLLDVHRISDFRGDPHGREGQPLDWIHPGAMLAEDFPAADRPIINALRLSDNMLITPDLDGDESAFLRRVGIALRSGVRLLQLRLPGVSQALYRRFTLRCRELCAEYSADLVANPPSGDWSALPAGVGLHLNSRRLMDLSARPWVDSGFVGASCHHESELQHAEALGLDYAVLSPVARTSSHPNSAPLGWERFQAMTEEASIPVYALGGMDLQDVPTAKRHGGQGIAAIRSLWPSV